MTVESRRRFDAGMSASDAARDIDVDPYSRGGEEERIVVNVLSLYRDFGADLPADAMSLMSHMAAWARENQ
jgi:hypothetical protein